MLSLSLLCTPWFFGALNQANIGISGPAGQPLRGSIWYSLVAGVLPAWTGGYRTMLSNNHGRRKSSRQRRRQRKRGLLFVAGQVRQMHSVAGRQELMICRAVLMCELEKSRRANRSTTAIKLEVDRCNAALGFSLMSSGPKLKPSLHPRFCLRSSRRPAIDEPARSLYPFWPRLCIYAMRVVMVLRRLGEAAQNLVCPAATRIERNPALEVALNPYPDMKWICGWWFQRFVSILDWCFPIHFHMLIIFQYQ